jgi:hypothetical protein
VASGTQAEGTADNSAHSDMPGFVKVLDDHTLLIAEPRQHCSRAPCDRPLEIPPTAWRAARFGGFVEAKAVDGEIRKRVRSLSAESYRRFLLKKSIVRVHASFAAASSYRGVVSLWKP